MLLANDNQPALVSEDAVGAAALKSKKEKEAEDEEGDIAKKIARLRAENPDNITLNTFDFQYYESLSDELKPAFLACLNSGIENPDSGMGCYPWF